MAPKLVFIIPYRDRIEHKTFFTEYMKFIMEDYDKKDYEIYFVHQKDNRPFNRGAMKNIGFLAISQKYPQDFKNITFVFHDVDTMPYKKNLLNYETTNGKVKHFYGFLFALGGIFSITGADFLKTNGFPNFWGWGMEDNAIQQRCLMAGLKIDRSNFYKIGNRSVLQFLDGIGKTVSKTEAKKFLDKDYPHGFNKITNLNYKFNNEYIDVTNFTTETTHSDQQYDFHDYRGPNKIVVDNNRKPPHFGNMNRFFRM